MTRSVLRHALRETKIASLIIVQMASGILAGLLIVGLVPGDNVNFNVLGSLILLTPVAAIFIAATLYRRRIA